MPCLPFKIWDFPQVWCSVAQNVFVVFDVVEKLIKNVGSEETSFTTVL